MYSTIRKWNGLPYPGFLAGLASILSLLTGARILRASVLLQRLDRELDLSLTLTFLWVWGLVWILVGIGLWLERNWARTLLRLIATASLAYGAFMIWQIANIAEQPPKWHTLLGPAILTLIAWWLRFWAEWPVLPLRQRLSISIRSVRGQLTILWSQLGRLAGRSYYGWNDDPILVAARSMRTDDLRRTLAIPDEDGPGWIRIAGMRFASGTALLCDWGLLGDWDHSGVQVPVQPNEDYILELQVARLRSSYGICTLRARLRTDDFEDASLQHRGNVPVDFGGIAVCDFDYLKRKLNEPDVASELADVAFGPLPNLGRDLLPDGSGGPRVLAFPSGLGDGYYGVYSTEPHAESSCLLIDMTK